MWLTKNMVDYAVREKIKDTQLTIADVDSIFKMSTLGIKHFKQLNCLVYLSKINMNVI